MSRINLTFPEFSFIDGINHNGDELQNRTVILHFPTMTMIEFLHLQDFKEIHLDEDLITFHFVHKNVAIIQEEIVGVIVKSFCEYSEIETLIPKAVKWYCDYLDWEDANIIKEDLL